MYFTTPDILIVEDEEFNRDIMARRLESCNYNLRFAEDGQQALDKVAEKQPDVVLLDIMLPEIMGLQVLHTLRQQYSMVDLPIIMVTAINEDHRIIRALELGANDYISKPINFPILLARLQTQLSLKQLSALNSEFLTTASHDLRKPLAMIQNLTASSRLKLSSEEGLSPDEFLQTLENIEQSAGYMNAIAEYILNTQVGGFAQIRLTKIPMQIDPLIAEVINRHHAAAAEKRINLISKIEANSPTIEVDRSRLAQVLDNLLGNAIKFCAANDTITVSTQSDDNSLTVTVSDTGPGIQGKEPEQLFEQAGADTQQAAGGMSLPVCRQIIELHDGELNAMNNSDRGARFWFRLPAFQLKPV